MSCVNWITTHVTSYETRFAVSYDQTKQTTANDGDVCLSFLTYDILKKIEAPYCLDVGADACWWSIFCIEHCPGATVDAFEPRMHPETFIRYLQTSYPNLHLHNVAVSNKAGTLPFTDQGADSHSRMDGSNTVPCITLDSFFTDKKIVHFLKIDTEGHELPILEHLLPFVSQIQHIVFECSMYWYGETLFTAFSKTLPLLSQYMEEFPYLYTLSRRGVPTLHRIKPEELEEFLRSCFFGHKQFDLFFSKEAFTFTTKFDPPPEI